MPVVPLLALVALLKSSMAISCSCRFQRLSWNGSYRMVRAHGAFLFGRSAVISWIAWRPLIVCMATLALKSRQLLRCVLIFCGAGTATLAAPFSGGVPAPGGGMTEAVWGSQTNLVCFNVVNHRKNPHAIISLLPICKFTTNRTLSHKIWLTNFSGDPQRFGLADAP
jgi:hypothetical protein